MAETLKYSLAFCFLSSEINSNSLFYFFTGSLFLWSHNLTMLASTLSTIDFVSPVKPRALLFDANSPLVNPAAQLNVAAQSAAQMRSNPMVTAQNPLLRDANSG